MNELFRSPVVPHEAKVGLTFLRMIAKELGVPNPGKINFTSWELTDCIIKDIHLRNDEKKRLKARVKKLEKDVAFLSQRDLFIKF